MSIIRSDELCDSPAARDRKSSSRVIAIIIGSLNNTYYFRTIFLISVNYLDIIRHYSFITSHLKLDK
jgi:hypothetical protein